MEFKADIKNEEDRLKAIEAINKITFKKGLPKSWEELDRVEGFYIDEYSDIQDASEECCPQSENIATTVEVCAKMRATAKLSQLMNIKGVVEWILENCQISEDYTVEGIVDAYIKSKSALKNNLCKNTSSKCKCRKNCKTKNSSVHTED